MRTPTSMIMPTPASLLTVPARTLLTPAALRERVEQLLRSDERLRRSFVPGREAFGFRIQGVDQQAAVSIRVRRLTARINRVEVTFHRGDAKLVGRLFDLLMPDLVDEFTLEIFRRAHADKTSDALVSFPEELLAA